MMSRLILPLCVAAALLGGLYARSQNTPVELSLTSHGAGACEEDGLSVGYSVTFLDDVSPRGYRVTDALVSGIDNRCVGHDIYVSLTAGVDNIGDSGEQAITGSAMTLPLAPRPLAALVDGIYVEIDDESLPAPTPPTGGGGGGGGGGVAPIPSSTPPPQGSTSPTPQVSTTPGATTIPTPGATTTPPPTTPTPGPTIVPAPGASPLPDRICDPTQAACGTKGGDHVTVEDGTAILGGGSDTVDVVTSGDTNSVSIDAGSSDDTISLEINAPNGSDQTIVIDAGSGADVVTFSFEDVAPGASVDITIRTQGGDDVVRPPASIPAGVTIPISTGQGDDRVIADRPPSSSGQGAVASFNRLVFANVSSGGYEITTGGGDDFVRGGSGPDSIRLGAGADSGNGAAGNDRLSGRSGNDRLNGAAGDDLVSGGPGRDELHGGLGIDELRGDGEKDLCYGAYDLGSMTGCEVQLR